MSCQPIDCVANHMRQHLNPSFLRRQESRESGQVKTRSRHDESTSPRLALSETRHMSISVLLLIAVCLTLSCAQSSGGDNPTPTQTTGPASTPTTIPDPTTAAPEPTPAPPSPTPQPTVTATPAPTPRTITTRVQRESTVAPDFEVETFTGETLRLSDLNGKVVVLNFWASWCPPCRWEMPFFETMWQEYRDRDVVFVGIAMSDTLENARDFAEESGVTYPIALDTTNEIVRAYEILSLPTTFFIGKDGNIERKLTSAANEGLLKVFLRGQLPRE